MPLLPRAFGAVEVPPLPRDWPPPRGLRGGADIAAGPPPTHRQAEATIFAQREQSKHFVG